MTATQPSVEQAVASWDATKAALPVVVRFYLKWWERLGRTDFEIYQEIKAGTFWPVPRESRPGHPPFLAAVQNGRTDVVKVRISLPVYTLSSLAEEGCELPDVVRCMTTWGGEGRLRDDIDLAWFGHLTDGVRGMLRSMRPFIDGRPHRCVTFDISTRLWGSVKRAAARVGSTPQSWLYGCATGFLVDDHGPGGRNVEEAKRCETSLQQWAAEVRERRTA